MNIYENLIISKGNKSIEESDVYLPYDLIDTADAYEDYEEDKLYIRVTFKDYVDPLGVQILVENIIFN